MNREKPQGDAPKEAPALHINFLDPDKVRFEREAFGRLSLRLDGEVYDHLRIYRSFPLSRPNEYIAVRVGDSELEQKEIGQIRDINALAAGDRTLILEEIQKRYFIHTVSKIISIREDMGYFYWAVETDKGTQEFPVPIRTKYVSRIGPRGRLISDVDGNRYSIPDLEAMDSRSRSVFERYIYW